MHADHLRRCALHSWVDLADEFLGPCFRWLLVWLWTGERSAYGRMCTTHRYLNHTQMLGCMLCRRRAIHPQTRLVFPIWCSRSLSDLAANNGLCFTCIRNGLLEVVPFWHHDRVASSTVISITCMYFTHVRECQCDICKTGVVTPSRVLMILYSMCLPYLCAHSFLYMTRSTTT